MGTKTSTIQHTIITEDITNIEMTTEEKKTSIDIPFSYFSRRKIRDFVIQGRKEIGVYWYFDKKNVYIFSINPFLRNGWGLLQEG